MSSSRPDALTLAEAIDRELHDGGTSDRAAREKAYLKSSLEHYGVSVPDTRAIVRRTLRATDLDHDGVIALAEVLWNSAGEFNLASTGPAKVESRACERPIHERRTAATMVLIQSKDHLGAGDADFFEALLRQSRTWALVDPLAGDLVGPLTEREEPTADSNQASDSTVSGFDPVLERWAADQDFWIRRSALLAHLVPLRNGGGDFNRFARFADSMLEEKEFFIRKAIGWVLRDTAKKRPSLVVDWLLPRTHRASGVTMREAVKHLASEQRDALLPAR